MSQVLCYYEVDNGSEATFSLQRSIPTKGDIEYIAEEMDIYGDLECNYYLISVSNNNRNDSEEYSMYFDEHDTHLCYKNKDINQCRWGLEYLEENIEKEGYSFDVIESGSIETYLEQESEDDEDDDEE